MVNLNNKLFGYTAAADDVTTMTVTDADAGYWTNLTLEDGTFDYASNVSVTLPEKFANDEVIAKQGDAVAIHRHNNGAGKNSYFLLGSDETAVTTYAEWPSLLGNIINEAAQTKRDVTNAAAPSYSLNYADQQTTVSISCATGSSQVYYKVGDGEYQLYSEPLVYTEPVKLTAYAVSEVISRVRNLLRKSTSSLRQQLRLLRLHQRKVSLSSLLPTRKRVLRFTIHSVDRPRPALLLPMQSL